MASSIPACKAALVEIIQARFASGQFSTVDVQRAMPTKDEDMGRDAVFIGMARSEENWSELGGLNRAETYSVAVTVYVEDWGDDPQAAEERVFAVLTEVSDALREDIRSDGSLRAAGVLQYEASNYSQTTAPVADDKWGARIDATFGFVARQI